MKANEAPEKIFICDYGSELSYEWHSESEFETKAHNDIEYTRTDAFIEKACDWLKEQDEIVGISFENDFIERFKNYMKGE